LRETAHDYDNRRLRPSLTKISLCKLAQQLTTMSQHEKDALPPSYTDTMSHPQPLLHSATYIPSSSHNSTLLRQLSGTRTAHITSVITTHILPLIERQASFGIAQTTVALLPSDIPLLVPAAEEKSEFSFDTPDTKAVEVIGFSSETEPEIVRLEGRMNRTEFWRGQGVIAELETMVRDKLNGSKTLTSPNSTPHAASLGQRQPRRNLLSRIMPSLGPEQRSPSGNPEVGVRQVQSTAGMVLVEARLEEICLRTVTDFGLYNTMSRQCVIVRIDARC
jgi:hypothetical protein